MFDKITSRILKLSEGLDLDYVDPVCHINIESELRHVITTLDRLGCCGIASDQFSSSRLFIG
jgi:hypothetical protein